MVELVCFGLKVVPQHRCYCYQDRHHLALVWSLKLDPYFHPCLIIMLYWLVSFCIS